MVAIVSQERNSWVRPVDRTEQVALLLSVGSDMQVHRLSVRHHTSTATVVKLKVPAAVIDISWLSHVPNMHEW